MRRRTGRRPRRGRVALLIVDLFAGAGGWEQGYTGHDCIVGLDVDDAVRATRRAAGLVTIPADVSAYPAERFANADGLIASPPCQAYSAAGTRDAVPYASALVDAVRRGAWDARPSADPRAWLVLEVGRWIDAVRPRWIALEQVPAVAPIWDAYAARLQAHGWRAWAGIVNAADYGVPQIRRRALLVAHRDRSVARPMPTHAEGGTQADLFGGDGLPSWVTMADALGWGMTERPYAVIASGVSGGPDREKVGGSHARALIYRERDEGRWMVNTGRDWKPGGDRDDAQTVDPFTAPAPTVDTKGRWHLTSDDDVVRLTIRDALVLQSFPPDYPVKGSGTAQYRQVGDAVPPRLAAAVLAHLTE